MFGQRGLQHFLRTHAPFELDTFVVRQHAQIGIVWLGIGQRAADAAHRLEAGNGIGGAQHQGVAALAKSDQQNRLAGLCPLQHLRQHQQRVRGAGVAAALVQCIVPAGIRQAKLFRQRGGDALEGGGQDEVADVGGLDSGLCEGGVDRGGHDLQVTLVANPALFPEIVVFVVAGAEVVDKSGGAAGGSQQGRDNGLRAEREGGCAGAEPDLLHTGRLAARAVACHYQRRAAGVGQRGQQSRSTGALRLADVLGAQHRWQAQRAGYQGCVEQVGEGHAGGRKHQLADPLGRRAGQHVASGFHRHRDAVFVPGAERALAAGGRAQPGRHPLVGRGNRRALHSQARNISPVSCNAVGVF